MTEGAITTVTEQQKAMEDPYFLSTNDGPGYVITTVKLKGENYEDWAKHVRNALRTKRKLGFLDGTIPKPTEPKKLETWGVVNSMMVAWIMNTIDPSIMSSVSMVEEAKVLWDDLMLQFSVGNGARIQELKSEIANCKQKGDSVNIYYGKLKKLWDELAIYKPIRSCTCGGLSAQLIQDQDEDRTHEFLMGLDSSFGTVRSNITSIEPLPKLSQVYQRVIREERQHTITKNNEVKTDVVGFSVQAGSKTSNYSRDGEVKTCKNCGNTGHDINDCFKLKGYPEWWGERGKESSRGRGRGGGAVGSYGRARGGYAPRANHAEAPVANVAIVTNPNVAIAAHAARRTEYDRSALPQLSEEQWSAILSLVQPNKTEQSEKLNGKSKFVDFIIDKGASHHMTWNLEYLSNVVDILPCIIGLPDGDSTLAMKQGDICLGGDVWLRGVLYAPKLNCSLISVATLLKGIRGSSLTFTSELCVLQDHTKMVIGAGEESGGVYKFHGTVVGRAGRTEAGSRDLWHKRLGHPSERVLSFLSHIITLNKTAENDAVCDTCFRAKQTRDSFPISDNKAAEIFDMIHCDVWGAYRNSSNSDANYFLTIVDDCSRAVWIFLMKSKTEVTTHVKNFFAMAERQFGRKVKQVRSDNGTEFLCLRSYFDQEGVLHQTSCVGTPQKNGRVERKHRHILNVARALLFQAKFPKKFWGECVLAACHIINRTPTLTLDGKTPYEILFGSAPSYESMCVLGCLCYAHKQLRDKDKFAERSRKCVFTGYPYGEKGWQVYDIESRDFFVSRDVVFHETIFPFAEKEEHRI